MKLVQAHTLRKFLLVIYFLLLGNIVLNAQVIQGNITDNEGNELPGVNVVATGTTTGTMTDFDGNYSLDIPSGVISLTISAIGYETEIVEIEGRTVIDIVLMEGVQALDEVVIVGYGTQAKKDITGSISSISKDDFNKGASINPEQLMQGRAAGVTVSQTTGEPGGGFSVNIRGSGSLNAGNQPLYVIDGIPVDNSPLLPQGGPSNNPRNPLNALNTNDIESIQILKDASATAIYGSRGGNGVVIITTKKGEMGDVQINYEGYTGLQEEIRRLDVLSTREYIDFQNAISQEAGNGLVFTESDINEIGEGTAWQDEIFQSAPIYSHYLSVSGGDENTTYASSISYLNQEGLVKETGIEKFTGRINVTRNFKNAQIGFDLKTSVIDNNNAIGGVGRDDRTGPINAALFFDPTESIRNEDGSFTRSPFLALDNPVSVVEGFTSDSKDRRTLANTFLTYNFLDNLFGKINFGYDVTTSKREIYISSDTRFGQAVQGEADITTLDRENILLDYTLNYTGEIKDHFINVLGGISYQEFEQKIASSSISGFPSDATKTDNLGLGTPATAAVGSNREKSNLLSYFGRVNYSFADKYLLTATLRADGSSRFGENNKFGIFPSFALGWRLSEEDFFPSIFNNFKLRGSWGKIGNQEIGNLNTITAFSPGQSAVHGGNLEAGLEPSRLANNDLQWESTIQTSVGLEIGILNNRISGEFEYFNKTTDNLIFDVPIPQASGFGVIVSNLGEVQNKGFEMQINTRNIVSENFQWNTTMNFSTLKNEVKDLGDLGDVTLGFLGSTIIREGEELGAYFGHKVLGIFQNEDEAAGAVQPDARPGDPIFQDTDGDGQITVRDKVILGSPIPDYTISMSNTFNYKRFQLDFFLRSNIGADLINVNTYETFFPTNQRFNRIRKVALDRWTPDNPDTKFPSLVEPSRYAVGAINSLLIEDADFLRLENINLTYNIPTPEVLPALRSAAVYVSAQNILIISGFSGPNPDENSNGQSVARVSRNSYPVPRTFIIGIRLGL